MDKKVPIKEWLTAAKKTGEPVSEHTLRFWQKVRVLPHAEIRSGHVGYLSLALINDVKAIRRMTAWGVPLRAIAPYRNGLSGQEPFTHGKDPVPFAQQVARRYDKGAMAYRLRVQAVMRLDYWLFGENHDLLALAKSQDTLAHLRVKLRDHRLRVLRVLGGGVVPYWGNPATDDALMTLIQGYRERLASGLPEPEIREWGQQKMEKAWPRLTRGRRRQGGDA